MSSPSKKRNIGEVVADQEDYSPNKKRKQENPQKRSFQSFKMKKSSIAPKHAGMDSADVLQLSTGPSGSGSSQINPLKEMDEQRI